MSVCDGCGRGRNEFAGCVQNHHVRFSFHFYLCVCVSVCDGCGRGRNEFAGRVQNHHVRFSFHRNDHFLEIILYYSESCCRSGYSALQATRRMPCGRLPSHYGRARTQDYLACWTRTRHDFSLTCHIVQRARQPLSRRAISGGSFTVAGDFVLQLIRLESLGSELQES